MRTAPATPMLARPLRLGLLIAGGLLLASCEVTETGPIPGPGPGPGTPQVCPRIYEPVCATRGRRSETFPNACEARADGFVVRYPGQCRRDGRPGSRRPRPDRPTACPMIYQPVCGRIGSEVKVYSNDCVMAAEGASRVPDRYCSRMR